MIIFFILFDRISDGQKVGHGRRTHDYCPPSSHRIGYGHVRGDFLSPTATATAAAAAAVARVRRSREILFTSSKHASGSVRLTDPDDRRSLLSTSVNFAGRSSIEYYVADGFQRSDVTLSRKDFDSA